MLWRQMGAAVLLYAATSTIAAASNVQRPTSNVQCLASDVQRRTSNVQRPTTQPPGLTAPIDPVWLWTYAGRPTREALNVIRALSHIDEKGLVPSDYDPGALGAEATVLELNRPATDSDLARFDALMSLTVARVLLALHSGRLDPNTLGFHLPSPHDGIDINAAVRAVANGTDVRAEMSRVEPEYAGYAALEDLLRQYRTLAADSELRPPLPVGHTIRPGDRYEDMPALYRLLEATRDLAVDVAVMPMGTSDDLYVGPVVDAVTRFQRRHGLDGTGILDAATMAALRVPMNVRVRQIELALEGWRWLPSQPPARYIVINIPAFRLFAFEDDPRAQHPVLAMDAIVGQSRGHQTPVFAGAMQDVVFRPYWDVPPHIARSELVPHLLRHPSDFEQEGYEIVRGGGDDAVVYPLTAENLKQVGSGGFRLRQRPGPRNALGQVKFVFPNDYNVYLHGTPEQELFGRARRDFSHGCIRLEDPAALAAFVLASEEGWSPARIDTAMHGATTVHVPVEPAVEVYVVYSTVVVDDDNLPHFYADVYGHDRVLQDALHLPPVENDQRNGPTRTPTASPPHVVVSSVGQSADAAGK